MGAVDYRHFIEGPDLNAGYEQLVRNEQAAFGNHPYSGSIKDSGGVSTVTSQVCTMAEAENLAGLLLEGGYEDDEARAERLLAALGGPTRLVSPGYGYGSGRFGGRSATDRVPSWMCEKDGTAAAIPVGFDDELTTVNTGVPVDLVALGLSEPWPHQPEIRAAIVGQLGPEVRIGTIRVLDDESTWRTTTRATSGKMVTRYRLYDRVRDTLRQIAGEDTHPSMSEARARVDELVAAPRKTRTQPGAPFGAGTLAPRRIEVLGEVVREDGAPLLAGERVLASRFVVFDVEVIRPTVPLPRVRGHYLFGLASC